MVTADPDSNLHGALDASSAMEGSSRSFLKVGCTWQGRYRVDRELPAFGGGPVFAGLRIADGIPVRLRRLATSADSETRRAVWQALSDPPLPGGPVLLESVIEDDGRIEVWQPVDGPTLEERLATAKLVTEEVAEIVRPLAKAIAALHERGLVYLQLGAERVVLADSALGEARLTRVEMCIPVNADGVLVPVPTDVTRMPPEGLGLYRMKADEHLKAWDWWTLGRLIQELWLAHTVMAHALGRDLPRNSDHVRKQAEEMLKEANARDPRAGGVEHMTDLPVQVKTLLRGLLTSVREARWGTREVMAWLDGKSPVERYDLPRSTVLIHFHDEQLTVVDTACRLLEPEHWREGLAWWAAENPPEDSLPAVLARTRSALHQEREWMEQVRELQSASAMAAFPVNVRNEILSALAWTGMAGKKSRFRWRGIDVGPELVAQVLSEEDGLTILGALLSRAVVTLVKRVDANAAWIFDNWSRQIDDARSLAAKYKWVGKDDETTARLTTMALSDVAVLDRRFAEARLKYRHSTDDELQNLFGTLNPNAAMLVVLGLSFENPKACGYVTHEAWRSLELERLHDKGERLVDALALVELTRLLKIGLPLFAPRFVWSAGILFILALSAAFWPGWTGLFTVFGLGATLLVVRHLLKPVVKARCSIDVDANWSWSAAVDHCRRLARASLEGGLVPMAHLRGMLAQLNKDIQKLGIEPPPEPVVARAVDHRLTVAAWGSWAVVIVVLTSISWQTSRPEWSLAWSRDVWRQELFGLAVKVGFMEEPVKELDVVKIDWPHQHATEGRGITYEERELASAGRKAQAEAFLAEVQRLYLSETLKGIVAIDVSTEGVGGAELVLIDVGAGKLFNGLIYDMAYVPLHGTWMKMANRDVIFLSRP